ncbi:MAG: archease [Thermoleophilia bacterium]|nr:archease [Thermoleophilia bacterium]MDH3725786.1 archease [Thermoleophilia bacterium]
MRRRPSRRASCRPTSPPRDKAPPGLEIGRRDIPFAGTHGLGSRSGSTEPAPRDDLTPDSDTAQRITPPASERGHRALPHTADVILEAWGPNLPTCFEEAVAALVELCVDAVHARIVERRLVRIPAAPASELLLNLLDEVIFALDIGTNVAVSAEIAARDDGALDMRLQLAARGSVAPTGPAPKGVSRSHLRLDQEAERVHCSFLIDV